MGRLQDQLSAEERQLIIISKVMNPRILAHEIGHACGLDDIYGLNSIGGTSWAALPNPIQKIWLEDDWSGGYYRRDLLLASPNYNREEDLLVRLMMNGRGETVAGAVGNLDIPLGLVLGHTVGNGPSVEQRKVGFKSFTTRQPVHR